MDLGARIKALRRERNLSQEAVANALNVSRQAVAKWEANTASPSTANLMALCQLFQISLDVLTQPSAPPARQRDKRKILQVVLLSAGGLLVALSLAAWLCSPIRGVPETIIGYQDAVTDIVVTGRSFSFYLAVVGCLFLVAAGVNWLQGKKKR